MSEMDERVARAIVAKMAEPTAPGETPWQIALQIARAAIEVQREPTKAMLSIGQVHDTYGTSAEINLDVWQAMIDESLK